MKLLTDLLKGHNNIIDGIDKSYLYIGLGILILIFVLVILWG